MKTALIRTCSLIVVVCVLGIPGRALENTHQGSVARSVMVTALDASGMPVKGLTAADFAVYEDGATREVISVAAPTEPLFVSLLVDTSKPPMGQSLPIRDLRTGLTTFITTVQTALPDAQIAYTELAGAAVQIVNFTTKTADLTKAVGRLTTSQRSSLVLFEGLQDTAKDLAKRQSPRRAIVSVTFGNPEASQADGGNVGGAVQRAGAQYWPIAIDDNSARAALFESLPELTGGDRSTAVIATSLESMLKRVAEALTSQYLVTYARPGSATGRPVMTAKGAAKVLVAPWVQ